MKRIVGSEYENGMCVGITVDGIFDDNTNPNELVNFERIRHGHWIAFNVIDTKDYSSKIRYMCNKCGRYEDEQEPYCNCGAKMDGDER